MYYDVWMWVKLAYPSQRLCLVVSNPNSFFWTYTARSLCWEPRQALRLTVLACTVKPYLSWVCCSFQQVLKSLTWTAGPCARKQTSSSMWHYLPPQAGADTIDTSVRYVRNRPRYRLSQFYLCHLKEKHAASHPQGGPLSVRLFFKTRWWLQGSWGTAFSDGPPRECETELNQDVYNNLPLDCITDAQEPPWLPNVTTNAGGVSDCHSSQAFQTGKYIQLVAVNSLLPVIAAEVQLCFEQLNCKCSIDM